MAKAKETKENGKKEKAEKTVSKITGKGGRGKDGDHKKVAKSIKAGLQFPVTRSNL